MVPVSYQYHTLSKVCGEVDCQFHGLSDVGDRVYNNIYIYSTDILDKHGLGLW